MRNQLKNQKVIRYQLHLGETSAIQLLSDKNYAIPVLDDKEQIDANIWKLYDDNGITVMWDRVLKYFTINGTLTNEKTIEIFEFATKDDYLYLLTSEYISGSTTGYVEFISGEENAITYQFNNNSEFILEYTDFVLFRFTGNANYTFNDFKFKLTLTEALYTGEKVDKYSEDKYTKVVVNNKMGKVYNEQMGLIYEYSSTIQHNGEPIFNEGTLVWIRSDHDSKPDFIVRSVVPSLNSTLYHLIKKEA